MEFCIPNFLGPERLALLDFALSQESNFSPATVSLGAGTRAVLDSVRRAKLLENLGTFAEPFLQRLQDRLPEAVSHLGIKPFLTDRVEIQMAASNDGDFFCAHQDGGPDGTRELSFVYFLHSEPRRFSGGELCIREKQLEPVGDTLVFFSSLTTHQVLQVTVPSRAFCDSRFTVNGWFHRPAARSIAR